MELYKLIIYSLIAVLMLMSSILNRNSFYITMMIFLCLPLSLWWIHVPHSGVIAMLLMTLVSILSLFYMAIKSTLNSQLKFISIFILCWFLMLDLAKLLAWPYAGTIGLMCIIPIVGYIYMLTKGFYKQLEYPVISFYMVFIFMEFIRIPIENHWFQAIW